jgi:hypothetical protein
VTAGYVGRGFGTPRSARRRATVRQFDKATQTYKSLKAESVFARRDFTVIRKVEGYDDSLERDLSDIEGMALKQVLGVNALGPAMPAEAEGIRALLAIHLARSLALKELVDDEWERTGLTILDRRPLSKSDRQDFELESGRPPENGEIEGQVLDGLRQIRDSNVFFVQQQANLIERLYRYLLDRPVSVGEVANRHNCFLVTSDTPAHLWHLGDAVAQPIGSNLGFGDEDLIVMPLTRRVVVAAGTARLPAALELAVIRDLNQIQVENESPWVRWRLLTFESRMEPWQERSHQGSRRRVATPTRRRPKRSGWSASCARSSAPSTARCTGSRTSSATASSRCGRGFARPMSMRV